MPATQLPCTDPLVIHMRQLHAQLHAGSSGVSYASCTASPSDSAPLPVISRVLRRTAPLPAGDIVLNEVLLLRLAPGAPFTLFYSADALYDAAHCTIRTIPHTHRTGGLQQTVIHGHGMPALVCAPQTYKSG